MPEVFRWLLKACAVGSIPSAFAAYVMNPQNKAEYAAYSAAIGAIFSVVMWGGFNLITPWIKRPTAHADPMRAALASMGRWMLVYSALFALCLGIIRAVLGLNLLRQPAAAMLAAIMGLLLSSIIGGLHTTAHLVTTARELEAQKARASFLALQAQLQPHTLFNSLNTIAALIPGDPVRAEEATLRLSALLRRILAALEQTEWPLRDEFNLLEDLLALESLRFEGRLKVTLRLEPAMAGRPVPPLLLLPLVENSLKHGFRPKIGPCVLDIEAAEGRVRVRDDGAGRNADAPDGVGLRTVRERLAAIGGELRWLDVDQGCMAEVRLP